MCGDSTPGAITSISNTLMVIFKSDFVIGRKGFSIDYASIKPPTGNHYFTEVYFLLYNSKTIIIY